MVVESYAVIAEAEPEFGWLDVLEAFHIAFISCQEAGEPVKEIHCGLAVDSANVGFGLVGPSDLFSHTLLVGSC